jgi:hypothetical protein
LRVPPAEEDWPEIVGAVVDEAEVVEAADVDDVFWIPLRVAALCPPPWR